MHSEALETCWLPVICRKSTNFFIFKSTLGGLGLLFDSSSWRVTGRWDEEPQIGVEPGSHVVRTKPLYTGCTLYKVSYQDPMSRTLTSAILESCKIPLPPLNNCICFFFKSEIIRSHDLVCLVRLSTNTWGKDLGKLLAMLSYLPRPFQADSSVPTH